MKPIFKIKVLKNGQANYDIFPESEESESSANFVLKLDKYAINESQIDLLDLSTDLELSLENLKPCWKWQYDGRHL